MALALQLGLQPERCKEMANVLSDLKSWQFQMQLFKMQTNFGWYEKLQCNRPKVGIHANCSERQ
ncbi:MAG: hypothetical protein ACJAZ1_001721 [Yoonia sp.]|jgi:hypothetical protein